MQIERFGLGFEVGKNLFTKMSVCAHVTKKTVSLKVRFVLNAMFKMPALLETK